MHWRDNIISDLRVVNIDGAEEILMDSDRQRPLQDPHFCHYLTSRILFGSDLEPTFNDKSVIFVVIIRRAWNIRN